jgi:hypothetical protein
MKVISKKLSVAVALSVLVLGGCGSTSKRLDVDEMTTNVRAVSINSTDEYKWDSNMSKALNLAEMGKPSGVGFGLRDSSDPTAGVQSKADDSKLLTFATGFYTGNILSGIGLLALDSMHDELLTYNPYIISFIGKDSVDLSLPESTANFINTVFKDDLKSSFDKSSLKGEFRGLKIFGQVISEYQTAVFLSGEVCRNGADFIAPAKDKGIPFSSKGTLRLVGLTTEDLNQEVTCSIRYKSSIAGTFGNKYIVIHEMINTNLALYFAQMVSPYSQMSFVFTEYFPHFNSANFKKYNIKFPYAFVVNKGEKLLFDSKEESIPIF